MYPYLKHQTQLFRFKNYLKHNFESDDNATNFLHWTFDFIKTDNVLTFAVLGIYDIYIPDSYGAKEEQLYLLNAGRVFEIDFYDPKDETTFKILGDCLILVHEDLKRISIEILKNNSLKRFLFPSIDLEAFYSNLQKYLSELEY